MDAEQEHFPIIAARTWKFTTGSLKMPELETYEIETYEIQSY